MAHKPTLNCITRLYGKVGYFLLRPRPEGHAGHQAFHQPASHSVIPQHQRSPPVRIHPPHRTFAPQPQIHLPGLWRMAQYLSIQHGDDVRERHQLVASHMQVQPRGPLIRPGPGEPGYLVFPVSVDRHHRPHAAAACVGPAARRLWDPTRERRRGAAGPVAPQF